MRYTLLLLTLCWTMIIHAQNAGNPDPLSGSYRATFNGDNLALNIENKSGASYVGTMTDSYQKYALALELSRTTTVSGRAKEYSLGLEFDVLGHLDGDKLTLSFSIDLGGEKSDMAIDFIKEVSGARNPSGTEDLAQSALALPIGSSHPPELIGTWTKEDLYQSGYGDSYMGAGFSQSMTFLPEGRLAEAGSHAYMSGSNYSGQSAGQGAGVIPGLAWYTIGNQLYMQVTENGQTRNVLLGKYYMEDNHILITGTNGEKVLLSRSN